MHDFLGEPHEAPVCKCDPRELVDIAMRDGLAEFPNCPKHGGRQPRDGTLYALNDGGAIAGSLGMTSTDTGITTSTTY